jgi:hypothetical protein
VFGKGRLVPEAAGLRKPVEEKRVELIASAMADPVLNKIFTSVAECAFRTRSSEGSPVEPGGITVREISEKLGEPRRKVRYRLDVLHHQGLVYVAGNRKQRGTWERCYLPVHLPILSQDDVEGLSSNQQRMIILGLLKVIFADAVGALEAETYMRRPEWVATRMCVEVDEQGWTQLAALHERFRQGAEEIVAEAAERLESTGATAIQLSSANLLFETAPDR